WKPSSATWPVPLASVQSMRSHLPIWAQAVERPRSSKPMCVACESPEMTNNIQLGSLLLSRSALLPDGQSFALLTDDYSTGGTAMRVIAVIFLFLAFGMLRATPTVADEFKKREAQMAQYKNWLDTLGP